MCSVERCQWPWVTFEGYFNYLSEEYYEKYTIDLHQCGTAKRKKKKKLLRTVCCRADRAEVDGRKDLCRSAHRRELEVLQGDWKNRRTKRGMSLLLGSYLRVQLHQIDLYNLYNKSNEWSSTLYRRRVHVTHHLSSSQPTSFYLKCERCDQLQRTQFTWNEARRDKMSHMDAPLKSGSWPTAVSKKGPRRILRGSAATR